MTHRIWNSASNKSVNAENTVSTVRSTGSGYILVDETRDLLLKENAVEWICEKIVNQLADAADCQFQDVLIDLSTGDGRAICYQSLPYTERMKDTLAKRDGIRGFQDLHITYQFGARTEVIDENVVADWMMLDENGGIVYDEHNVPLLDETLIKEYMAYLSATYNTVEIEREFHATRGDIVKVSGGSYRNEIDEQAEYAYLLNAGMTWSNSARQSSCFTDSISEHIRFRNIQHYIYAPAQCCLYKFIAVPRICVHTKNKIRRN